MNEEKVLWDILTLIEIYVKSPDFKVPKAIFESIFNKMLYQNIQDLPKIIQCRSFIIKQFGEYDSWWIDRKELEKIERLVSLQLGDIMKNNL